MISFINIKKTGKSFAPFIVIITLPIIFFWSSFIGKTIIVAGDFTGSDLLNINYPFKVALAEAIKNRQVPLWTPYLSNGFPLLAESQTGVFYPPNIIFSFLPPYLALNYSVILTFILSGLFTYLYCRKLGFSNFGSLFSAISFMFSAFFVARIKHLNLIAVASWLPFVFWTTKNLFQKKKAIYIFLTAVGLGFQFLAGHPQMAFYCLFIFLIYFVFEFFLTARKSSFSETLPKALFSLTLITFITLGLSLIQLLPTLELSGQTERIEYTFAQASAYPFHPKNLITFISPYFLGNPALGSYKEDITETGVFWENASFFGLLAFSLSLLMIFLIIRKKEKESFFLFFSFLALFSLIMMLGKFTPLFGFLWTTIPGFSIFRFPTRFNLFLIFSLSILAGKGSQIIVNNLEKIYFQGQKTEKSKEQEKVKFTWPLDSLKTKILVLTFIIADLFVFAKSYVGTIDSSLFLKKPDSIKFLEKDNSTYRILSLSQYTDSPYQFLGWKKDTAPLLSIKEAIPPDDNIVYKISTFSDRSWFEGGYNYKRRNKLERWLLNEAGDPFLIGKILGLFNVKYLLTFFPLQSSEMTLKKEISLGKHFGAKLNILENKQVVPRVFYVPEAKVLLSENAVFDELTSASFYPAKTVLLEKQPKHLRTNWNTIDSFKEKNQVKIEKYNLTEVVIQANLKDEGFLILSDSYYPGWKAMVNGKPQEIFQANYLVRALEMKPGKHLIRFYYDPLPFKIGAAALIITLVFLLLLTLISILKRLTHLKLKSN